MASEATKMVVIGNMHMGVRVIEVTELNSEVRSDLQGHYHCHPLVFRAIALQVLRYDTGRPKNSRQEGFWIALLFS